MMNKIRVMAMNMAVMGIVIMHMMCPAPAFRVAKSTIGHIPSRANSVEETNRRGRSICSS